MADQLVDGPQSARPRRSSEGKRLGRLGGPSSRSPPRHPIVRARLTDAGDRHRLPLGELADLTCARCGWTAGPVRIESWGRARRLHGRARPARWGGSWPRCSAFPAISTGGPSGASGSPSSSRNFRPRRGGEDRRLDRIYLPREDRDPLFRASAEADLGGPEGHPAKLRAHPLTHEVNRAPRPPLRGPSQAGDRLRTRPRSAREVRFAIGPLRPACLDRVERTDVLAPPQPDVRILAPIPGAALRGPAVKGERPLLTRRGGARPLDARQRGRCLICGAASFAGPRRGKESSRGAKRAHRGPLLT